MGGLQVRFCHERFRLDSFGCCRLVLRDLLHFWNGEGLECRQRTKADVGTRIYDRIILYAWSDRIAVPDGLLAEACFDRQFFGWTT